MSPAASTPHTVHFHRSGVSCSWDPNHGSILELAEAHGVSIPTGCRCGLDNVCQVALLSGRVRHLSEPMDLPPGDFLPCVSVPESDLVVDA